MEHPTDDCNWTEDSSKALINLYGKYIKDVGKPKIKTMKQLWVIIAEELSSTLTMNIKPNNCENRWRVLERRYRKYCDSKSKGCPKKYCEYFDEMEKLCGQKKRTTKPVLLISSPKFLIPQSSQKFLIPQSSQKFLIPQSSQKFLIAQPSQKIVVPQSSQKIHLPKPQHSVSLPNKEDGPGSSKTDETANFKLDGSMIENIRQDRLNYQNKRLKIENEKLQLLKTNLEIRNELLKQNNELIKERNEILKQSTCSCLMFKNE